MFKKITEKSRDVNDHKHERISACKRRYTQEDRQHLKNSNKNIKPSSTKRKSPKENPGTKCTKRLKNAACEITSQRKQSKI